MHVGIECFAVSGIDESTLTEVVVSISMTSPAAYWRLRVQSDCIQGKTFGIENKSKWPAVQTSSTSTKAYRLCIPEKRQAPGTVTPAQR